MTAWPIAAHELLGKTFVLGEHVWLVLAIDPKRDRAVLITSARMRGVVPLGLILIAARMGEITLE